MGISIYKKNAVKYCVEDLTGALLPGTPLSNVLKSLEVNEKPLSNTAQNFLKRKGLFGLLQYAKKEVTFNEFLKIAKKEQANRQIEHARFLAEAEAKALRDKAEQKLKNDAIQARLRQRSKAKEKQSRLKHKYGLDYFIERDCYPKLMHILRKVENRHRLTENDVIWLNTDAEEYFTQELRESYHKNEAQFYEDKFKKDQNPWSAVSASSHYRKCREPENADSLLSTINVSKFKNKKIKSAISTTHAGVNRDLRKWDKALSLGEYAHQLTPKDFRPCTLLGAVHMETGNLTIGQSWYQKAIERGYSEESMDHELKTIFRRSDKIKKQALRKHLFEIDPYRYSWVNDDALGKKIRSTKNRRR